MLKCKECGKTYPDGTIFCDVDGSRLNVANNQKQNTITAGEQSALSNSASLDIKVALYAEVLAILKNNSRKQAVKHYISATGDKKNAKLTVMQLDFFRTHPLATKEIWEEAKRSRRVKKIWLFILFSVITIACLGISITLFTDSIWHYEQYNRALTNCRTHGCILQRNPEVRCQRICNLNMSENYILYQSYRNWAFIIVFLIFPANLIILYKAIRM